jgi:hypothetical protein
MIHGWKLKSLLLSLFLVCSPLYASSPARDSLFRPQARVLNSGGLEVGASVYHFSTTAVFDVEGEKISLDEEDDFRLIDGNFHVRYGYGPQLELRGELRARMIDGQTTQANYTAQGIESGLFGLRYGFISSSAWQYSIDASVRNTFYTTETYETANAVPFGEQALGDSGTSFKVGGHLSYVKPHSFHLNSHLFYHLAPTNLSDEILYQFELAKPFTSFLLAGGFDGVVSMNQDQYFDVPEQKPRIEGAVTGLFNSINRSYTRGYVRAGYAFENISAHLKVGTIMSGKSTDEGNFFVVGLNYSFGGTTASTMRIESFKEYYVEASVLRVSPRAKFVKIDKGLAADIKKGMRVDIFQTDFFGGNALIASGVVFEVQADSAIIRLEKRFSDREIRPGFTARAR